MKEILIIETVNSQPVKNFLEREGINYKIYQEPHPGIFANYGAVLQDKERELEAHELENAEVEDIIDEEW